MRVNRLLSIQLAQDVEARPKECWLNALCGLYTPWFRGEVYYVEGLLRIFESLWIEHGWLEVNGEILDPTLFDQGDDTYHAVFRYNRTEVWLLLDKYGAAPRRHRRWPFYEQDRERRQLIHKTQAALVAAGEQKEVLHE